MTTPNRITPGDGGFTIADLDSVVEDAVEGENGHIPVIVRLRNTEHGMTMNVVDCKISAVAVELVSEDNSGKVYQLVLDIENPLE